jgi:hypothetical protein
VLAWPTTKPTARSFVVAGVTVRELGDVDVDVDVVAVPIEPSNGLEAATPVNSCSVRATAAVVVTVTLRTGAAFDVNHISPSEFCPETA